VNKNKNKNMDHQILAIQQLPLANSLTQHESKLLLDSRRRHESKLQIC